MANIYVILSIIIFIFAPNGATVRSILCPVGTNDKQDGLCDVDNIDNGAILSRFHPMSARAQFYSKEQNSKHLSRQKRQISLNDDGSGDDNSASSPLYEFDTPEVQKKTFSLTTEWSQPVSVGIPIFCRTFKRIYISNKGYISFDRRHRTGPTVFPSVRQADDQSAEDIVAAFLSFTKGCSDSWSYFSHFRSGDSRSFVQDIIKKASADITEFEGSNAVFEPSDVFIVTWKGTLPDFCDYVSSCSCNADEGNNFQLVLTSDGRRTYAMYNYKPRGINARLLGKNIRFGYQFRNKKFQVGHISGREAMQTIDSIPGNTRNGKLGRWIFRLYDAETNGNPTECNQYENKCLNWLSNTVSSTGWIQWSLLPCPCNSLQAWIDRNFARTWTSESNQVCYRSRWWLYAVFPSYRNYLIEQRCCYRSTWRRRWGTLITTDTRFEVPGRMRFIPLGSGELSDRTGHDYCCKQSRRFCHRFYQYRPADRCLWYRPPWFSNTWGDPHIVTLDGLGYTFNGLGSYWMVKTMNQAGNNDSFNMQVQTSRVTTSEGTLGNATVFTRFAARDHLSPVIEIQLDKPNGLKLYVEKAVHSAFDGTTYPIELKFNKTNQYDTTFVTRENQSEAVVNFPSGWAVKVTANQGFLSVEVSTSQTSNSTSFSTRGLLGVMDQSMDNDFTTPDGSQLGPNSKEIEIYHNFGQKWAVNSSEESLFFDQEYGVNETFIPEFNPCETFNLTDEAMDVCKNATNKACMYDYCVTRNKEIASYTLEQDQKFKEEQDVRVNTLPQIVTNSSINVVVEESVSIHVNATDKEGDDITLELENDIAGAIFNNITGEFIWTPSDTTPVLLGFTATDSRGGSISATVEVILCNGCTDVNHGSCNFDDKQSEGDVSSFYLASCDCTPGYEGESCGTDIDGCANNPCDNCTDLTPAQEAASNFTRGYRCHCNDGYELIQDICIDINECERSNYTLCNHKCVDIEGSYKCKCNSGYRLSDDLHNCTNIDECNELTDNCEQLCKDQPGTFECDCFGGYTIHSDNRTCLKDNVTCDLPCDDGFCVLDAQNNASCECKSGFQVSDMNCTDINECDTTHGCNQLCNNTVGGYTCSCDAGFQIGTDPRQCIECDDLHWGENCNQSCSVCVNVKECHNTKGCVCLDGYRGSSCAEDINECNETIANCTGINEVCLNTLGSYECQCASGFVRNGANCDMITTTPPTTMAEPQETTSTTEAVSTPPATTEATSTTEAVNTPTATTGITSGIIPSTAKPNQGKGKINMKIKTNMKFKQEYKDPGNQQTKRLTTDWEETLYVVYKDMKLYSSVEVRNFSKGSLIVNYKINLLVDDTSPENISYVVGYIGHHLETNNGALTVGNETTQVESVTAVIDGTTVSIKDGCSYLNEVKACNHGKCNTTAESRPVCVCDEGYEGEYCTESVTSINLVVVIVSSCLAGVFLIISVIGAICLYLRRNTSLSGKSKAYSDWDDDDSSHTSSGSTTSSSDRTQSVWYAPYSKSNAYRAYGLVPGEGYPKPRYNRYF